MRINCEIFDLQAFLAVLDDGSFHHAAERLNMSQPAVSRRVKALEVALGVTLLERTTRSVKPTKIGRELEPALRRLVCEFENCVFSLGEFGVRHPGELTIASIPTASASFLPRVVKKFIGFHPDVRFRIADLSAEEGLESVARGEAEFGINFLGASRPELSFTPLIDDAFVIACRSDHSFASRKEVAWSDLIGESLIISQRSGNRAIIDQALAKCDLRLNWTFQVVHIATSFGLVEAGVGLSIVPRLTRPVDTLGSITIVPVSNPVVHRTVGIVERRSKPLSRAAIAFRKLLVDEVRLLQTSWSAHGAACPVGQ